MGVALSVKVEKHPAYASQSEATQAPGRADTVRSFVNEPDNRSGLLRHRLWSGLADAAGAEDARRNRHLSYELARAGAE